MRNEQEKQAFINKTVKQFYENKFELLKKLDLITVYLMIKESRKQQQSLIEQYKLNKSDNTYFNLIHNQEFMNNSLKHFEYLVKNTQLNNEEKYFILNGYKIASEEDKQRIDKKQVAQSKITKNLINNNGKMKYVN